MTYHNQNESRWNRFGEPFAHFLGGSPRTSDTWVNRKTTRNERKHKSHLTNGVTDQQVGG